MLKEVSYIYNDYMVIILWILENVDLSFECQYLIQRGKKKKDWSYMKELQGSYLEIIRFMVYSIVG